MKKQHLSSGRKLSLNKKMIMPLDPETLSKINGGIATDQITNSYCCAPPPASGGTPCCPAPATFGCRLTVTK